MRGNSEFDRYAGTYDQTLQKTLAVSGEDQYYFARGRLLRLSKLLRQWGPSPRAVMDFGCGIGSSTPYLLECLAASSVLGVDVSPLSLEVARRNHSSAAARFQLTDDYQPSEEMDLVFTNGVYHHIPHPERTGALEYVYRCLRPGGLFALFENNPWNPGTRYLMGRCPFDRDAIPLAPPQTRRLLEAAGFQVLLTDFLFIFPRVLKWLRWIEPLVARMPLGAQYLILSRKPYRSGLALSRSWTLSPRTLTE